KVVGESEARHEIPLRRKLEASAYAESVHDGVIGSDHELAGAGIEVRLPVVHFDKRYKQVIAQSQVEGQARIHLEVVLHVPAEFRPALSDDAAEKLAVFGGCVAEQHRCDWKSRGCVYVAPRRDSSAVRR